MYFTLLTLLRDRPLRIGRTAKKLLFLPILSKRIEMLHTYKNNTEKCQISNETPRCFILFS